MTEIVPKRAWRMYIIIASISIITAGNSYARTFSNTNEAEQAMYQAVNSVIQPTSMYQSAFFAPSINNVTWQAFAKDMQEYVEKNATLPLLGKDKEIMAYYKNIMDYAQLLFNAADKAHSTIFNTTGTAIKQSVHVATIKYLSTIEQKIIALEKNSKINALYRSSTTVNAKKNVITVLKAFIEKLADTARMAREGYEHRLF